MMSKTLTLVISLVLIVSAIFFIDRYTAGSKPQENNADILAEEIAVKEVNKDSYPTEEDLKRIEQKSKEFVRAKELVEPDGYINTDKITISEQIGKNVVLVDFWTYSCINCQRTLPYLTSWYEKYKDKGLVIIGVHTPEFVFEKEYDNVLRATEKFKVTYPVAQDNEYKTWHAYNNRYWPRKYLIDIDGFIVYDHIGEGAYDETEKEIQKALEERMMVLGINEDIPSNLVEPDADKPSAGAVLTPEIYFGYEFSRGQIGNKEGWKPDEIVDYTYPEKTEPSRFYLNGRWLNNKENMELVGDEGSIKLSFLAKKVNIVASSSTPVEADIYVDGVFHKKVEIMDSQLYNIASFDSIKRSVIEIKAKKGLKAYTFTFG